MNKNFFEKDLISFEPLWPLRGGHIQTLAGEYFPHAGFRSSSPQRCLLQLVDGDVISYHHYVGDSDFVVILGHGLTGHAEVAYFKRLIYLLNVKDKHSVVCFNHRNCGDGQGLAKQFYHSGRSEDFAQVIADVRRQHPLKKVIAVGFSMSGNVLLRLLGDHKNGGGPQFSYPDFAITFNAPINLERSSRLINQGFNKLYQAFFMKGLKKILQHHYDEGREDLNPRLSILSTTMYDFDDLYTGPYSGFKDAKDYYQQCSALFHLQNIECPTVMITAKDDPFVHYSDYLEALKNPNILLRVEKSGGHMGFIHRHRLPTGDHRWMEYSIRHFVQKLSQT